MATKVAPLGRHGLPTDLLDAIESFGYKLGDFVGKGSFSLVFAALDPDGRSVALKIINDTCKEKRVFNECNHLCRAGGTDNVVQLLAYHRFQRFAILVLPLLQAVKFRDFVEDCTMEDIRHYMRSLLVALRHIHSLDIVHRDVKPQNFLYNADTHTGVLLDFGLAETRTKARPLAEVKKELNARDRSQRSRKRSRDRASLSSILRGEGSGRRTRAARKSLSESATTMRPKTAIVPAAAPAAAPRTHTRSSSSRLKSIKPLHRKKRLPVPPPSNVKAALQKSQSSRSRKPSILARASSTRTKRPVLPPRRPFVSFRPNQMRPRVVPVARTRAGVTKPLASSKRTQRANRAGTPGFRPPEVLLASPRQTEAVDMWAAGIVLASLLTRRYPLLHLQKSERPDLCMLAQIVELVGLSAVERAAKSLGKALTMECQGFGIEPKLEALVLETRSAESDPLLTQALDLVKQMLDPDPHTRVSAAHALEFSPFLADEKADMCESPSMMLDSSAVPITPTPITPQDTLCPGPKADVKEAQEDEESATASVEGPPPAKKRRTRRQLNALTAKA